MCAFPQIGTPKEMYKVRRRSEISLRLIFVGQPASTQTELSFRYLFSGSPPSKPQHKGPTTIHALPDKALAIIFEWGGRMTLQDETHLPFVLLVSQVSHRWRSVTHAHPSIWANIPIPKPQALTLAEYYLGNAQDEPLSIYIHARDRGLAGAFHLIFSNSHRLRSLALRVDTASALFLFLAELRNVEISSLQHLELYIDIPPSNVGQISDIFLTEQSRLHLSTLKLEGSTFSFQSPTMRGLTSLSLSRLPRNLAQPSYLDFRELLEASPSLDHLCLDGIVPKLESDTDYPEILLSSLRTLEVTIPSGCNYVSQYLDLFAVPMLHRFKYVSQWKPALIHQFELSLPVLAARFAGLRELHLSVTSPEPFTVDGRVDAHFFLAFPYLQLFVLDVFDDSQALYFLERWTEFGETDELDYEDVMADIVWPCLNLLVLRAPYDTPDDDSESDDGRPSLDEVLEELVARRMSLMMPFEVHQGYVFEGLGKEAVAAVKREGSRLTTAQRLNLAAARRSSLPPHTSAS
ncbi:hypothetical protein K474DRAFT_1704196 [Panus rudis PR-1116 ss-1]|nr:hypothetical protein K474DRAFT_1704196 [Panus rudis PR-1116 ss-1]